MLLLFEWGKEICPSTIYTVLVELLKISSSHLLSLARFRGSVGIEEENVAKWPWKRLHPRLRSLYTVFSTKGKGSQLGSVAPSQNLSCYPR